MHDTTVWSQTVVAVCLWAVCGVSQIRNRIVSVLPPSQNDLGKAAADTRLMMPCGLSGWWTGVLHFPLGPSDSRNWDACHPGNREMPALPRLHGKVTPPYDVRGSVRGGGADADGARNWTPREGATRRGSGTPMLHVPSQLDLEARSAWRTPFQRLGHWWRRRSPPSLPPPPMYAC